MGNHLVEFGLSNRWGREEVLRVRRTKDRVKGWVESEAAGKNDSRKRTRKCGKTEGQKRLFFVTLVKGGFSGEQSRKFQRVTRGKWRGAWDDGGRGTCEGDWLTPTSSNRQRGKKKGGGVICRKSDSVDTNSPLRKRGGGRLSRPTGFEEGEKGLLGGGQVVMTPKRRKKKTIQRAHTQGGRKLSQDWIQVTPSLSNQKLSGREEKKWNYGGADKSRKQRNGSMGNSGGGEVIV